MKHLKGFIYILIGVGLITSTTILAAGTTSTGIGEIADNVTKSFGAIGKLMIAISYIAGIGFSIAGIFKFKQHKDNPTQIPLGTPLALLVIGIVLVFLPSFFMPAGQTLFGDKATDNAAGGPTGSGFQNLPGGKTGQ